MRIKKLLWPDERVDHIARHGVTPAEVEEICFGNNPLVLRAESQGKTPFTTSRDARAPDATCSAS